MTMPGKIASPQGRLWLISLACFVRGSGGIAPSVHVFTSFLIGGGSCTFLPPPQLNFPS